MGKRSDRWKKSDKPAEANLIPVMGLMAILIPVLLQQQEYIKIAGISVNAPVNAPAAPAQDKPKEDKEKKLNLTVSLTSLGYYLHAGGEFLPPDEDVGGAAGGNQKVSIPLTEAQVYILRTPKGDTREVFRIYEFKGKKYIDGVDPITDEKLQEKISALQEGGGALTSKTEKDFNYPALNFRLAKIKDEHESQTKDGQIFFNAEPNVPFWQIVRTMDAARYRIEKKKPAGGQTEEEANMLFPKVIFGTVGVGG